MCVLARPASNSKAASDTLRSVFHDEINRWHTRYVARTKRAWAESAARHKYKHSIRHTECENLLKFKFRNSKLIYVPYELCKLVPFSFFYCLELNYKSGYLNSEEIFLKILQ
jgi:hypothetical protein